MNNRSKVQKIALRYAIGFFAIVGLNYIPGIHDASGNMFGLFHLDPIDDILHLITAIWALSAGIKSTNASVIFFKIFGVFYFLDGLICFIFGQCIADATILINSNAISLITASTFVERLLLNLPHMIIGGIAIYVGYIVSKRVSGSNSH